MKKEKFEDGAKLKISHGDMQTESVALFKDLVLDLSDMMPTGNIEGAIKAGALDFVPQQYLQLLEINKENAHIVLNTDINNVSIMSIGETVVFDDNISVTLLAIRFKADDMDDWQTKNTS